MGETSGLRVGRDQLRLKMAQHLTPVAKNESPGLVVTHRNEADVVVISPEVFLEARVHATEGIIARKLWDLKDRNQHPSGTALVSAEEFTSLTVGRDVQLAFYADAWSEASKRVKARRTQHLREFFAAPHWDLDLEWVQFPGRWMYSVVTAGLDSPGFIVVGRGSEEDYMAQVIIAAVIDLPSDVLAAWVMGSAAEITS